VCDVNAPTAQAGPAQTVSAAQRFRLTGTGTSDGALLSQGSRVDTTVLARDGGREDGGCTTSRRTPARTSSISLVVRGAFGSLLLVGLLARRRQRTGR